MAKDPSAPQTFVFLDIEDHTALWQVHGQRMVRVIGAHNRIVREVLAPWNGVEVKLTGDGFMLCFAAPADAVGFAVDAQRALQAHDWTNEVRGLEALPVRMGVHTGHGYAIEGSGGADDYLGPAAILAARLCDAANGGQVLCSDATQLLAADTLPAEYDFADQGLHRLKGVGERRLWRVLHPGLPLDSRPPKALPASKHNLPLLTNRFVARAAEIDRLVALMRDPVGGCVTVFGPGGIGKSRLALQVGELLVEEFRDGVWWIALEDVGNRDAALAKVAEVFGVRASTSATLVERVSTALRSKACVLMFDGTEGVADFPSLLPELLPPDARPRCLVTSRRPLGLTGETLFELAPLSESEAQSLFAERSVARSAEFRLAPSNQADVAQLCRRLDGLPLAIEIAAGQILTMTPHEMLDQVRDYPERMKTQLVDVPERQRTLTAAIDWSYRLLPEDAQRALRELGVFVGTFSALDAEAVCSSGSAQDLLAQLRRHSLLRAETDPRLQQTRFSQLNLVRRFAAAELSARPEEWASTSARHAVHLASVAERALGQIRTPQEADGLREIGASLQNLGAALTWAVDAGDRLLAARLALQTARYWQRRGIPAQGLAAVEVGLNATQGPAVPAWITADLLLEMASLGVDAGDVAAARSALGRLEAVMAGLAEGVALLQARARNIEGLAALAEKRYPEARQQFAQARGLSDASGNALGVAMAQNNLGLVELEDPEGDLECARSNLADALTYWRRVGDLRGLSESLSNLGLIAVKQGHFKRGLELHTEALDAEVALSSAAGVGRALFNMAESHELLDELEAGAYYYEAAARALEDAGSPYLAAAERCALESGIRCGWTPEQRGVARAEIHELPLEGLASWTRDRVLRP